VPSATWKIDVKRAGWIGPAASGRVDFISRERARDILPGLHDAARLRTAGEFAMPDGHWDRFVRTQPGAENPGHVRTVQYTDAAGAVRGAAIYTVEENDEDFTKSAVTLSLLVAADDDAYAGLWRFFLEMDLVGTLTAGELSVDEPLLWMIRDQRAAVVTVRDHHYLRILDVPAVLEARAYAGQGTLVLDVDDPLGLAGGRFLVRISADGAARVDVADEQTPPDAVHVRLGIAELSAAYLGGVSLATLAAAGRVTTTDAAAAARLFDWHFAPRLSFWY
jgi:predicted acetyltransferase